MLVSPLAYSDFHVMPLFYIVLPQEEENYTYFVPWPSFVSAVHTIEARI